MIDCRDGKAYATVEIGSAVWMKQNLNIGTIVVNTVSQDDDVVIEKYCIGDSELGCSTSGGMYQWAEAMGFPYNCSANLCGFSMGNHQGICPNGWHMPKVGEWDALISANGGNASLVGAKMKLNNTGYTSWDDPLYNSGNNSSGFSAYPAGIRKNTFGFDYHGSYANFWEARENSTSSGYAYARILYDGGDALFNTSNSKQAGFSVRCVKD